MITYFQPISPAAKDHMEAQFSLFADMSKELFHTVQKINELNIQVAQTVMEEAITGTHQLLVANDPYEALSIAAAQVQPVVEKMRAYLQHISNIAAGTQVDLVKTAELHVPETSRTAIAMADEVARQASEETEKVTRRQKAAMESLTNLIHSSADGGAQKTRKSK
ncbi:MAG: phasin family domain protein [Herminiimonas sp.]|jgi:phasin family protein|nr:phasin family domain protein [Herminiimonas sp.]